MRSGKIGTEGRTRLLMMTTTKERHGAIEVADPDLGGAGVEVEGAFFVHLGLRVRWGKDLDADLGRASEYEGSLDQLWPATVEPGEVDRLNPIGSGYWAFGERSTPREELQQKRKYLALAVGVSESWRWTHDDMSMPVGLDPVGELSELRLGHDLRPTSQIEPGLRSEIRKLNSDRHARKIHNARKEPQMKYAEIVPSLARPLEFGTIWPAPAPNDHNLSASESVPGR
jgi:hypothetical protein